MPEDKKILIVAYNEIRGIPLGRWAEGNLIVHSGDYGRDKYCDIGSNASISEQIAAAERVAGELVWQCRSDLDAIKEAYVYVGASAFEAPILLIETLIAKGKLVRMVACDCMERAKREAANRLGIEWIMSECGGRETLARLVRELA